MTTFTRDQIDAIRREMDEEHRKDIAALERLQRFVPAVTDASGKNGARSAPQVKPETEHADTQETTDRSSEAPTLIGSVLALVQSKPNISMSNRDVMRAMEARGFPFTGDERRRLTSIHSALITLARRGAIRVVRRGSGKEPNLYRARIERPEEAVTAPEVQTEMTM